MTTLRKHHDGPTEYEIYHDDEWPFEHTRTKHRHYVTWIDCGEQYGEWYWETGPGNDGRYSS